MTLYTSPQQINPTASLDDLQAPFLDSIEASGEDAYFHNPANALGRMAELGVAELNSVTRTIPAEELNERFGNLGLTFKRPEKESVVSVIVRRKLDEIERRSRLSRASGDVGTVAAQFLTGLAVSVADPINAASSFVPVVGASRYAMWVERFGKTGARFSRGAIEGAVGAAAVEPLVLAAAAMDQSEYGLMDSLLNVTFGTAIGGGLHVGFGALSDRLSGLRPSVREGALRSAVAQTAEGRPVNVDPVLRTDARYAGGESAFDPLDPRFIPELNEGARPPAARPFERGPALGEGRGERFVNYSDISAGDLGWMRAVVDQVERAQSGHRVFLDNPYGPGQEVIGVPGDTPEWFQRVNQAADDARKARRQAQRTAARQGREEPKPGDFGPESILTREKLRTALTKIEKREPLGREEIEVAETIFAVAREQREANARDIQAYRDQRADEARAEIEALAERERAFDEGRDPPEPDEAAAVREAQEAASDAGKTQEGRIDADALDEEVADLTAEIDAMVRQGALTEEEAAGIARGVEPETVKAYQDGALAAARCMLLHP